MNEQPKAGTREPMALQAIRRARLLPSRCDPDHAMLVIGRVVGKRCGGNRYAQVQQDGG